MTVLALDGGKNIGFALFTDTAEILDGGIIDYRKLFSPYTKGIERSPVEVYQSGFNYGTDNHSAFKGYRLSTIVVEGIRHNPDIDQGGSQRWESQVEGAVRMLGAIAPVKIVVQPSSILPVALMHEGMEWPKTRTGKKKHLPDDLSAWLHGRYYFRSIGVLE